jgi:hypothetical protein
MVSQRQIQHLKSFSVLLQLVHVFQANVLNDLGRSPQYQMLRGYRDVSSWTVFKLSNFGIHSLIRANTYNSLREKGFFVRSFVISNILLFSICHFLVYSQSVSTGQCQAGLRAIVSLCPQSLLSMYDKHIEEENIFNISQCRQPQYKLKASEVTIMLG